MTTLELSLAGSVWVLLGFSLFMAACAILAKRVSPADLLMGTMAAFCGPVCVVFVAFALASKLDGKILWSGE